MLTGLFTVIQRPFVQEQKETTRNWTAGAQANIRIGTSTIQTRGDETCGKFDSTAYIQTASWIHPAGCLDVGSHGCRNRSDGMATGQMTEIFLLHRVQTDSRTHSASCAMGKLAAQRR